MNGLRKIASRAGVHLRHNRFNCLPSIRTRKFASPTFERPNLYMVPTVGSPTFSSYTHFTPTQFARKPSTHWSSLTAALVGLGGAFLVLKNSNENVSLTNSLFPSVECAAGKKGSGKCEDSCAEPKCDSECLRKTDKEDELIQKANAELEKALRDTKPKAVEFVEEALKAYCDAIDALKKFMTKVYCAVEEENLDQPRFDEVWCDVDAALKKRCELVKVAMEKGACAAELLRRLREIVENGKDCKYTQCNRLLVTAESTLVCAEKEVCAKKTLMDTMMKESRSAEQYKNMIEEFRRDLKQESDSLIPSEECRVTYTENEVNMVLAHAYKKIIRAQKEINKDGNRRC